MVQPERLIIENRGSDGFGPARRSSQVLRSDELMAGERRNRTVHPAEGVLVERLVMIVRKCCGPCIL